MRVRKSLSRPRSLRNSCTLSLTLEGSFRRWKCQTLFAGLTDGVLRLVRSGSRRTMKPIRQWLKWMTEFQLGRKRILDTQYAALLHTQGVRRLLTNNPDDFRVFNV